MGFTVVCVDNTVVFGHEHGSLCHKTHIILNETTELIIGFNPTSSLYDEKNFNLDPDEIAELKAKGIKVSKALKPFNFNRWYVSKRKEDDKR